MNQNTFDKIKDNREKSNIVMLIICYLLYALSCFLLVGGLLLGYMMLLSKKYVMVLVSFATYSFLLSSLMLLVVMVIDTILKYSENVERVNYSLLYNELTNNCKLLILTSIGLYSIFVAHKPE